MVIETFLLSLSTDLFYNFSNNGPVNLKGSQCTLMQNVGPTLDIVSDPLYVAPFLG